MTIGEFDERVRSVREKTFITLEELVEVIETNQNGFWVVPIVQNGEMRYVLGGRVPAALSYEKPDGADLDEAMCARIAAFGPEAMRNEIRTRMYGSVGAVALAVIPYTLYMKKKKEEENGSVERD